ncbi:MAG: response regulator [bacterium]|nr:response regulator [bacterium]
MARILIIDDDQSVRGVVTKVLEMRGHEIAQATDGEEGVHIYQRAPADLVITDLKMPGKTGLEVIQELVDEYPNVRIIVLSGSEGKSRAAAIKAGAWKVVIKPFHINDLVRAVQEALETP